MPPKSKKSRGAKVPLEASIYEPPQSCAYDWPLSFTQLQASPYQEIDELIDDQIYTLPRFFPQKVCDDLIRWFLTYLDGQDELPKVSVTGKRPAEDKTAAGGASKKKKGSVTTAAPGKQKIEFTTTAMPPPKGYAARVNDRAVMVDRAAARSLWAPLQQALLAAISAQEQDEDEEPAVADPKASVLKSIFGSCVGLNENFRVYRYRPGHYFGQHYDEANFVPYEDLSNTERPALRRGVTRWTMLVYLTGEDQGEVEGGATMFYPEIGVPTGSNGGSSNTTNALEVKLEKGTVLLHKHGQDCLLHEGALVTSGAKWVLRSDLVFPMA